jgi:MinD-like ATPase involved in chromosome partitioning or flagellar assembly
VARTGGNEIGVVLGKVDEAELATGVGKRLLATLEPEFHLGDQGFQVKISMGVALFPQHGTTADALLRQARREMYVGPRSLPVGAGPAGGAGGMETGAGADSGGMALRPGAADAGETDPVAAVAAPTKVELDPVELGEDLTGRVALLEPVSLFLTLPDRVLRRIARYMSEQAAGPGEEVAGPTSPAALRIIHEGACEVRTEHEGESLKLLTLGPGDFMGVDSLFSENPLPVSIRALTECKLLVLEGDMVTRAAPPGSAFRTALRQAAGQRDSHLRALLMRPHRVATGTGATEIAIYSTKGGSGRTTLALNLGAELGRRHPGEVRVVDLALPHPAGFMALPATLRPEEAELVTPELLLRAMKVLAHQFRYIIFDLGLALDDVVLATLEMSDHLVLVATPELASMHDTRQLIELATNVLHIPAGRVHTVLNNRSPDSLMSRKVVEEVLGQPLAAEFRYFGAGPEMAGLEGRLQVQSDPGGHFSRSVRAIIDRVGEAPSPEAKRYSA